MKRAQAAWGIAAAAAIAFAIKILLALTTYGTNDVYAYDQFSAWTRYVGVELYRFDPLFNHPPSTIYLLHFLSWLANTTSLPFQFWMRLPAILADAGNLFLVWKLTEERTARGALAKRKNQSRPAALCAMFTEEHGDGATVGRSRFWALILLALAPPLLLISGFHGNTDSLVIFFLLVTIYAIQKDGSPWAAGAAYGLAHCVKIFPIIIGPAILFSLPGWSRKIKFLAAAGLVILVTWSPYLFQDPSAVIGKVFGYRSSYGLWGFSFLLNRMTELAPWLAPLNAAFERFGSYLALALVTLVTWRVNRTESKPPLYYQAGIAFFLFLFVSSGFGVQYLAWLAPMVAGLGWAPAAMFYATSGIFLFLVYNYWAQGFPWYLADSNNMGDWRGYFDHAQLICWLSLFIVLLIAWKRWLPFPEVPTVVRWGAAFAALVVVFAVPPSQGAAPRGFGGNTEQAVRVANAESYLQLSELLCDRGRYRESMETAQLALALAPDGVEAKRIVAIDEAALAKK